MGVETPVRSITAAREQRIKLYCDMLKQAPCSQGAVAKVLGIDNAGNVPDPGVRWYSFKLFTEQNFLRDYDIFSDQNKYTWPKVGSESKKSFKALEDYSKTPFGAVMIQRILLDNKISRTRFVVKLDDNDSPHGTSDNIKFPSDFPRKQVLLTGESVIPTAIIHHEFGHTRFYAKHQRGKLITLQDEREVVINMENPIRLYLHEEPRYAYYNDIDEAPQTINIITGEVKPGLWKADPHDPRKLVNVGQKG